MSGADMRRLLLDDGDASVPPLYARSAVPESAPAPPAPAAAEVAPAAASTSASSSRSRGSSSRRSKEPRGVPIGSRSSSSAEDATPSTSVIAAALTGGDDDASVTPATAVAAATDNSRNTATMLSDSQSEREIAEFGRVLDDMLARVTCRELVRKTAEFMKAHPQHAMRFQFKIKQVLCV